MTAATRRRGAFDAPFVLAIDVGSSSVKAALFDSRARMLDHTAVRVAHRIHPTPDGGVEEAPDHLVSNVEEAVDGVIERAGAEAQRVAAVLALRAAGLWQSLNDVGPELGSTYLPDPERVSVYLKGEVSHDILYDALVRRDIS